MNDPHRILLQGDTLIRRKDGVPFPENDWDTIARQATDLFADQVMNLQVAVWPENQTPPDPWESVSLRQWFAQEGEINAAPAFRARALASWRAGSRYCGRCGSPMRDHGDLTARQCSRCGDLVFPRLSPCVIVTVEKEGKILLAKHAQRNQNLYACLAGFVEAGESVEEAVRREVREEVGVEIKNLRYRGSQSWPFPDQLMLAFTADWASGEIQPNHGEIADAAYFDPNHLPVCPRPGSISYRLIHRQY